MEGEMRKAEMEVENKAESVFLIFQFLRSKRKKAEVWKAEYERIIEYFCCPLCFQFAIFEVQKEESESVEGRSRESHYIFPVNFMFSTSEFRGWKAERKSAEGGR